MKQNFIDRLTRFLLAGEACFFVIDFEKKRCMVYDFDQAAHNGIFFDIDGVRNYNFTVKRPEKITFEAFPVAYERYKTAFDIVQSNIRNGNTYLLNLTFPTEIRTNLSLKQIFIHSGARYKLLFQDRFVVFSPETFVKIHDGFIYTYPMKGTIDATIPGARDIILNNKKELYEHYTVVDLLRNDLAIMARDIEVTKFRYIDLINTHKGPILQVSSEIRGVLPADWKRSFARKLLQMLPAGSISGAPKQKTVEIIRQAEPDSRGFYTGIFGIFHNERIITAVSIRYIERQQDKLIFRSGGGITAFSKPADEYKELIQKVYVPIR